MIDIEFLYGKPTKEFAEEEKMTQMKNKIQLKKFEVSKCEAETKKRMKRRRR